MSTPRPNDPDALRAFAEQPTTAEASRPADGSAATDFPASIGRYTIEGELGRGGMGVVLLARQQHPDRRVALKVMSAALDTERARQRFGHEVEVLGRLQHPGIAQIYDAGTAEVHGLERPYFAMELVEGETLTAYAEANGLGTAAKLRLLAVICRAIHHAHTKGVIHRDIKPGNIIVDTSGRPKVLDFGVARAIETDHAAATRQTEAGQLVGTLPYMSPEQVSGDLASIDTRSDVYALGVIGYQLLAGELPYRLSGASIIDSVRTITDGTPTPLSTHDASLRGDIATIIGKALEKDRSRRYQSAQEMADDIERYLRREPIMARPPSTVYTLTMFARRNRALVGGAAMAVVLLIAGTAATTTQAIAATRAQKAADLDATIARETNALLDRILASADPAESRGAELTVAEVLDNADTLIETSDLPDAAKGAVLLTIGRTYMALARLDDAERRLVPAAELLEASMGADSREAIGARRMLGVLAAERGQADIALETARRAHATLLERFGPDDPDTIWARSEEARALVELGRGDEAIGVLTEVVEQTERVLGREDTAHLTALNNLASAYRETGELIEAEGLHRLVVELRREIEGEDHPNTITARNNLATVLVRAGKADEAEALLRETLEQRRRVLGDRHRGTLNTVQNLSGLLLTQGRLDEAEPLVREAYDLSRELLGPLHANSLNAANQLAYLVEDRGDDVEAERLYRQTIEDLEKLPTRDHPENLAPLSNLASLLRRTGRLDEAEAMFADVVGRAQRVAGNDHYITGIFLSNHGECLGALGRVEAARERLTEAVRILSGSLGPEHTRTVTARERLEALPSP